MMRRRQLLLGLAACGSLAPAWAQPWAQQPEAALNLTLGTATPGGSFPAFGRALIATLRDVDPGVTMKSRITKGSTENLNLLKAGQLDLALVQGEYA